MKRTLVYLTVFTILIFFMLLTQTYLAQKTKKNGFSRKIEKQNLKIEKVHKLPTAAFHFAGQTEEEMYFKDLTQLGSLYVMDDNLSRLKKTDLKSALKLGVQLNHMDMDVKDIMVDNLSPISPESLAGRQTLVKGEQISRELVKLNYPAISVQKAFPLPKQVDGYFCTDGILRYDTRHSRLFYMYVYRGEFLCMDTNLNLLYKSKTIDTVTTARIEVKQHKKNGKLLSITQAKQPKPVNRNLVLDKNNLYLLSAIKSDPETPEDFKDNQVIDVYTISNGTYRYSFYIPKYKGLKLRDFRIREDYLFAIFDAHLIKFKLENNFSSPK